MKRAPRIRRVLAALALSLGATRTAATEELGGASGEPWFEEVGAAAGVSFTCRSGHIDGRYLFPEIISGGCALFDMDGDADLDLYLVQGGSLDGSASPEESDRLFRNDGGFRFVDVTDASGIDERRYGIGACAGDADEDGDSDLYVLNVGRDTLLRNDGGGRFADVTQSSGTGHPGWGTSGAFLDADADGDLDLWVVNYVNWTLAGELDCYNDSGTRDYCLPTNYEAPASCALYRNDGAGKFTDVTQSAGLRAVYGNGLGVTCGDFDATGSIDVFVANDTMMNQLWLNDGTGRFHDEALLRGCALDEHGKAKAGMGTAAADVDGDLDLDLLVVNLARETDSFFANEGEFFADRTASAGLGAHSVPHTRFGTGFADFDNDGVLDIYQANGRVQESPEPPTKDPYAEENVLLRGTSPGTFEEATPAGGTAKPLVATSRAAAFGDLDQDGGIDLVVVNRDGPAHILRNVVQDRGKWIAFRVLEKSGRDALGAVVSLTFEGRRARRDVSSAYSYACANDPRVHFGLGAAERVSDVRVKWVDGTEESFGGFDAGRIATLRRGSGAGK
jgi:hypothetical protein